jgi:predicted CXXCH cytochrome family protein
VAALLLVSGNRTQAFHSGGVAECGGCHSMHSSTSASYLLKFTDPSSTCLDCHESAGDTGPRSYHSSTADVDLVVGEPPLQRPPGGDFAWLKKTFTWTGRSGPDSEEGYTHGHNIIAVDNNYVVDGENSTAPGGTYAAGDLGCQSCHDPHGQLRRLSDGTYARGGVVGQATAPIIASGSYSNSPDPVAGQAVGVYRLLRGGGDSSQGVTFVGAPIAVAPSSYNRTEAVTPTRVAYGRGPGNRWGDWCATCHELNHPDGAANFVHPVDQALGSTVAGIYNAYVASGDLTGDGTAAFQSLVPFANGTSDIATLKDLAVSDGSRMAGPSAGDQVTCLSCHRAHASGWKYALRWNMEADFMVYNSLWPGTDNGSPWQYALGRTELDTEGAYYDRPPTQFASYQRVLCNKCHAKD